MKLQAWGRKGGRAERNGRRGFGWGRAGTAGTILFAIRAAEETLLLARMKRSRASRATVGTRNICWQGTKRWLGFHRIWMLRRQDRCCARVLRRLIRCGIAERQLATWLACRESAVWGIWEFSSPRKLDIASRPSDADQRMRLWRRNWERLLTLIRMQRTPRRN